jgi:hypothetical protein
MAQVPSVVNALPPIAYGNSGKGAFLSTSPPPIVMCIQSIISVVVEADSGASPCEYRHRAPQSHLPSTRHCL